MKLAIFLTCFCYAIGLHGTRADGNTTDTAINHLKVSSAHSSTLRHMMRIKSTVSSV